MSLRLQFHISSIVDYEGRIFEFEITYHFIYHSETIYLSVYMTSKISNHFATIVEVNEM